MSKLRNISLAEEVLTSIQDNEIIQLLKELDITDSSTLFNDREETIGDYMFNCGYSEKEAGLAYENLLNY